MKDSDPAQWYSKLKRLSSYDQQKSAPVICEEISDLSDQQQAELLADQFSGISNEYDPIKRDELIIPPGQMGQLPQFTPLQVLEHILKLKTSKSTVQGDIPAAIIKRHAEYICVPLTHVLNTCIRRGEYPNIWKMEIQTPVPKEYPPVKMDMLRNISNLKNFDKVAEMMLGKLIVSDMSANMDPSQYGNKPGVSVQHYLMKMLHTILLNLDNNQKGDTFAVLAAMIDWKQAFPRQDPTLGVQSFIDNGVRGTLIPLLVNYFEGRVMAVKWHQTLSSTRNLSGGGPQGATLGLLEYLSQSNDNADNIDPELRYKWLDDLTALEVINLLTIGISCYNMKAHVASDIPVNNGFINKENLQTQLNIDKISQWTREKKMKLNHKKSSLMCFNFTHNFQFTTRMTMEGHTLQLNQQTKLLGVIITNDITWSENTRYIIKRANARMELLRKLVPFNPPIEDMKTVYILYIRSILEQSSNIWHSDLTIEDQVSLERVQKNAFRNILQDRYTNYESALHDLKLETLYARREKLLLNFGKKCTLLPQTRHLFPLNNKEHNMNLRRTEKYKVINAHTSRLKNSTVPYIQRLLNEDDSRPP